MKALDFKFNPESKGQPGSEAALQRSVKSFLDFKGEVFFHTPNGGLRQKATAVKLKREGVKAGVPDVFILSLNAVVELKVGINKPTLAQLAWLNKFKQYGFAAYWVNSLDEFIELYNYLKKLGQ